MRNSPAIAAVTEIQPGRYPQYDEIQLHRQVLKEFFQEWKIDPKVINGIFTAPTALLGEKRPEVAVHELLTEELGITPTISESIYAGGATYSMMVQRAALAIAEGRADCILCVSAGKFPKVGKSGGETTGKLVSHPEFEFIYGAYIPPMYALIANRYMHEFGITQEQLASVSVSSREWALKHPKAFMRNKGPLSIEDVLNSRPISSPFHLLDCSVPCEGGAAVLVTSETVAKQINPQPAYIVGMGEIHGNTYISQRRNFSIYGSTETGKQAYSMANVTPGDIDVVQFYDSFSINPIMYLEEFGFCKKGMGGRYVMEGHTSSGGDLPMNTYGGLLSFGHTGDASGMSMMIEGALQVMGKAEERQVDKVNLALVHTHGGMMSEHSTLILGRHA